MYKNDYIKVGWFVTIALAVTTVGLLWMNNISFKRHFSKLTCYFDNVHGLKTGDPVFVRGLKMGRVDEVSFVGDSVLVIIAISNKVHLRKDARITLINTTVIAENKYIEITPGVSDTLYDLSKPLHGYYRGIDQIFTFFDRLQGIIAGLKDVSGKNTNMLSNLNSIISRTNQLITDVNNDARITSANIRNSSQSADSLVKNLLIVSKQLKEITAKMNNPKNNISKFSNNDSLYRKTMNTVNDLDSLICDVKQHPSKYIKINLIKVGQ